MKGMKKRERQDQILNKCFRLGHHRRRNQQLKSIIIINNNHNNQKRNNKLPWSQQRTGAIFFQN